MGSPNQFKRKISVKVLESNQVYQSPLLLATCGTQEQEARIRILDSQWQQWWLHF